MEIRGRAKDVIISGGENISAIEVEHALVEHPAVVEAAVIGIPDERWGELVRAHVIVRAARPPAADELIAFLRSRLAGYKIPRTYVFETDLPRTATGKVQKFRLRAEQDASRAAQGAFQ